MLPRAATIAAADQGEADMAAQGAGEATAGSGGGGAASGRGDEALGVQIHRAACLCGGVSLQIEGPLEPIQVCHCSQCRRAQGGPFATNIPVQLAQVRFLSGESLLQAYESAPGKERVFCRVCGSPIFSRRVTLPDAIRLRAGLLAEPVAARPAFHAYVGSRASWWSIDDDLPRFDTAAQAPPRP